MNSTLLLPLVLTLNSLHGTGGDFVFAQIFHGTCRVKLCRLLCHPDLQLRLLYDGFLLAQSFIENFPAP